MLSDTDLVAGEGEAARLVSYIRADETPHVAYLQTVLTEMRDRTFVGDGGKKHAGADLINTLWDRAVTDSLGVRRAETVKMFQGELAHALEGRKDAGDVTEKFNALAS